MKQSAWKRILTMAMCLLMMVMILPVMARETEAAEANAYEAAVKAIDDKKPKTQKQLTLYDSKTKKKLTGLCSVCSMTTLLNRRLAYDNKSGSFSAIDVVKACGGKDAYFGKNNTVYAHGYNSKWSTVKYTKDGVSYQAARISASTVKKAIGNYSLDSFKQYVALQLHEHPEGIAARFNYSGKSGGHVIVFTKYAIVNGKVQLYVFDPVNNKLNMKFEDSYMYKNGGKGNIHKKLDFISYLKGSKKISPLSSTKMYLFEDLSDTLYMSVPGSCASYTSSNTSVCTADSKGVLKAKKAGSAEITVKRYSFSYKVKMNVLEAAKLRSVKGKLVNKATVSWEKNGSVSGYQLQYSQNKSFPDGKTKAVTYKPSVSSATVSSLTLTKTYYFRIRSYVKSNGKTIYSSWSPVVSYTVLY